MKIRPVQRYPDPNYPLQEQVRQSPELLKSLPTRWEKAPGFAALLGVMALATARAEAATAEEGTPPPALDPEAAAGKQEASAAAEKAGAVVAPILAEALEHDGRGSFGCVAVSPPSFLAEDEALDLIRAELEAAGLRLRDDAVLEGVMAPTGPGNDTRGEKGDGRESRVVDDWGNPNQLGLRPVQFDWVDPDRAVYIEYLTRRDYREWEGLATSTADTYDFPELAQKVVEAYGKYPAGRQTTFGVFFDPLAHPGVEEVPVTGLAPEEERLADAEYKQAAAAAADSRGRDKLRRQVRHFVEFLREEGVLGPAE